MSRRRSGPRAGLRTGLRAGVALTLATLLTATLAAGPGQAETGQRSPSRSGPPAAARATADADTVVQRIKVKWQGSRKKKRFTKAAVVPGIGSIKLVCRPDNTIVRLYADDRSAETQMWMAKYEVKNDRDVVAVKNARVYRYATADDDGHGGTGASTTEGLNQLPRVENYANGYARGVISQRPGRNQPAGTASLAPVTSFTLSWYWNGFDYPSEYRACKIRMTLRTELNERIALNWHGDADAAGHTVTTTTLAGVGDLELRCETGRDGDRWVALTPLSPEASVWVEYITGEGRLEYHVESYSLGYDPVLNTVGPLELPRNGMMRLYYTVAGVTRAFILSSYLVTNNATNPELNVCEVSAAAF